MITSQRNRKDERFTVIVFPLLQSEAAELRRKECLDTKSRKAAENPSSANTNFREKLWKFRVWLPERPTLYGFHNKYIVTCCRGATGQILNGVTNLIDTHTHTRTHARTHTDNQQCQDYFWYSVGRWGEREGSNCNYTEDHSNDASNEFSPMTHDVVKSNGKPRKPEFTTE